MAEAAEASFMATAGIVTLTALSITLAGYSTYKAAAAVAEQALALSLAIAQAACKEAAMMAAE